MYQTNPVITDFLTVSVGKNVPVPVLEGASRGFDTTVRFLAPQQAQTSSNRAMSFSAWR